MGKNKFIASASSAGKLMIGGKDFTDKDQSLLDEYYARENGTWTTPGGQIGKPLKDMDAKIAALEAKKEEGFRFGETAISYIEDTWLKDKYGYRKPMVTKETLKGQICEQDSFKLVDQVLPSTILRSKCRQRMYTGLLTGNCDSDLEPEDMIEDVKTSWDLGSFFAVREAPELYFAQGQVYMRLYGRSRFRLIYCLVDTPFFLLEKELNKYRYMFSWNGDKTNEEYVKIEDQLHRNHTVEHRIPAEDRVKFFEFERDDAYISELERRVEFAQEVYDSLKLNNTKKSRFAKAA
ncbi:MAG: hypothetical protein ACWA44_02705 [Thiotrichales bacterium]